MVATGSRATLALAALASLCPLVSSAFAQPVDAPIWPMAGYDLANTNGAPWATSSAGHIAWSVNLGDGPFPEPARRSPVVASDGTVYAVTEGGSLYAIAPDATGRWSAKLGVEAPSSPAIAPDGTILVVAESGELVSVNPAGEVVRRTAIPPCKADPVVLPDGRVCLACLDRLLVLDATGAEVWSFPVEGECWDRPALDDEGTAYLASTAGLLYAVDANGGQVWRVETGGAVEHAPCLGPDGLLYIGVCGRHRKLGDGRLLAFDRDGAPVAGRRMSARPAASVTITASEGHLGAADPWGTDFGDGVKSFRLPLTGPQDEDQPSNHGATICRPLGSASGDVHRGSPQCIRWTDGEGMELSLLLAGDPTGMAAAPDGTVYVLTTGGVLYALADPDEPATEWPYATDDTWRIVRGLVLADDADEVNALLEEISHILDRTTETGPLEAVPAAPALRRTGSASSLPAETREQARSLGNTLYTLYDLWLTDRGRDHGGALDIDRFDGPPFEWLADPEPAVRLYALREVPACRAKSRRVLELLADDPDLKVRQAALRAVVSRAGAQVDAAPVLRAILLNPTEDPDLRAGALTSLAITDLGRERGDLRETILSLALSDTEPDVLRLRACGLAAGLPDGSREVLEYLLGRVEREKPTPDPQVVGCLGVFLEGHRDTVLPVLVDLAEGPPPSSDIALHHLCRFEGPKDEAAPLLLRLASDPTHPASISALRALPSTELPPDAYVAILREALASDDDLRRANAIEMLGDAGPRAADLAPELLALCKGESMAAADAARALGRVGVVSDEVVNALVELACTPDAWGAEVAMGSLIGLALPDDRRVDALMRVIDGARGGGWAHRRAIGALVNCGDAALPALRQLADEDGWIADAARLALETWEDAHNEP